MKGEIDNILRRMQSCIEKYPGIVAYSGEKGPLASRRLWNLLRSSLMRLTPEEVADFLENEKLKISEMKKNDRALGPDLAEQFFRGEGRKLRKCQEALILACLEMDASLRLDSADAGKSRKESLKKNLRLWEVK